MVIAAGVRPALSGSLPISVAALAIGLVCLAGIVFGVCMGSAVPSVDYNQFYSASKLVGTGQSYNWPALQALETVRTVRIPTARLPIVLFGHKLLAWMPYAAARTIWFGLSVAAFLTAGLLWPGLPGGQLCVAACWSIPVACVLAFGQDVAFWVLAFALGLALLQRRKDGAAGLVLSLCICKFHLAVGLPVMLLAQRRYRAFAAATMAVPLWIAACFAVDGIGWPARYLRMTAMPEFSTAPDRMPCLLGLFPDQKVIVLVLMAITLVALWRVCRHTSNIGIAGAITAATGVIVAPHALVGDCALMLPLCVFAVQTPFTMTSVLKPWALLLLSPGPALFLGSRCPWTGQCVIVGFLLAFLAAQQRECSSSNHPLGASERELRAPAGSYEAQAPLTAKCPADRG